eukprot:TRINITY_DN16091_c0_g1_i2.p2 TRINITY_DN16091_c0_g1~~TRINITY_DN16091_c0_g1_i2.p2  ORF type:complete len:225 (+),score=55.37 TRINITY_DN16091_c0_g1_i2:2-676(+)
MFCLVRDHQIVDRLCVCFLRIRGQKKSTHCISSAASDVYKRQGINAEYMGAMLNRWWTQKRELHKKVVERPKGIQRIQNITTLTECEKWRNSILKEINKKVTVIQNAGLGEQRIRELNDEINQLLREKNNWEHRILELGGPNYRQLTKKQQGLDFLELPGFGGYKYFGAAKDLPGVRELFQKEVPAPPKEDLVSVYKNLDMEYYLGKKIWNCLLYTSPSPRDQA